MNAQDNPHDHLFKKAFSEPDLVAQYLREFLEPEVVEHLDLAKLVREPTSYLDENLRAFYSDIVYRVPYGHNNRKITISFLFEHKSTPPAYPHFLLKTNEFSYEEVKQIVELVPKEIKSMTMSAYDMLINRGIEQGLEKGIQQGIQEGVQQGLEQGLERGREQGIRSSQIKIILNAHQQGMDLPTIAAITELSPREVKEILARES